MNNQAFYRPFLFLILLFTTTSFVEVENASISSEIDACTIENTAFQAGEVLVYKVFYNWNFVWLSAGEFTFKVEDAGKDYHLSLIGKSYKSYDWFYKVYDRYDTYVDKQTLLPHLSTKTIAEGDYRVYDKSIIDQNKQSANTLRGKSKSVAKQYNFQFDNCMHDMISIMYHARNIDFNNYQKGQVFPIEIFMDKTVYPLNVKHLGRDNQKYIKGKGQFDTIIFSPEVVEGKVFKEDDQMKVWVTNDKNKIPVLIESPLSVGSVKIVLKDYKGLKHDLSAKLK